METLRENLRGILKIGWDKNKFDADWFERAWIIRPTPLSVNISTFGLLQTHKQSAINRIGSAAVERIFKEEVDALCARIKVEKTLEYNGREETQPLLLIPFSSIRQEAVGHGGFHSGALGTYK